MKANGIFGSVPGIEENVDLNVFNGTLEELKKMTIDNVAVKTNEKPNETMKE